MKITQGDHVKEKGMACASDDDDEDVMGGEGGGKELSMFQKALKVDEISHLNQSEQSHNNQFSDGNIQLDDKVL